MADELSGEQIKKAREDLKETQAEFGLRFGVDQSTVHRWETRGLPASGTAKTAVERALHDLAVTSSSDQESAA